jgi:protein CpxP
MAQVSRKEPGFRSQEFMKSIRFRFLVAALAVMLGAAMAHSQTADAAAPPAHEHGVGMLGHMLEFPFKELNLSDAQHEQIKALIQKEHPAMKPLMMQLHGLQQQLKPYSEGTYDEAKVQAIVAQQAQTLVQMKVQETRIRSEVYQLLTPEQQTKLKEIEANHEARMQQHMQSAGPSQE